MEELANHAATALKLNLAMVKLSTPNPMIKDPIEASILPIEVSPRVKEARIREARPMKSQATLDLTSHSITTIQRISAN